MAAFKTVLHIIIKVTPSEADLFFLINFSFKLSLFFHSLCPILYVLYVHRVLHRVPLNYKIKMIYRYYFNNTLAPGDHWWGIWCRGCANQYLTPWMTWNRLIYQQIPRTPSGTFRREEELLQSIRSIPARRKLHDKNSYTEAVQSKPGVNQKR